MRRAALLLLVLLAAGCGDDGDGESQASSRVTVSAAASLKRALTAYDPDARFSFAGSDELAGQIRQGARPDVYAAANTKLPDQLYAEGLVEKPAVFASNRLVLAVPAGGAVASLEDLGARGTRIAVGAESVPIGAYTREVLSKLPAAQEKAIVANFASEEPDVGGVVGKLTQGAVDAGFVYVTDVAGAGGKLKAVDLPDRLQPRVAYAVAVVKGARNPAGARVFVDGLVQGAGQQALADAGFEPPPP